MRLIVWLTVAVLTLWAHPPTVLEIGERTSPIERFTMGWLDDPTQCFNVQTAHRQTFRPISNRFTLGHRRGAQWFRIVVRNDSDYPKRRFLYLSERFYETVHFYLFDAAGRLVTRSASGQAVSRDRRDINNPAVVFAVPLPPRATETILLRIRSTVGTYGEITLHSRASLQKTTLFEIALFVFFLGALFSLLLYALIFFALLREKLYLYFAGYLLLFGLVVFAFSGNMGYFTGVESSTRIFAAIAAMLLLFVRISRTLLATDEKLPRIDTLLRGTEIVMAVDTVAMLIVPYRSADFVAVTFAVVFPLLGAGSLLIARKGDTVAWIYFLGLATFLFSMTIILFISLGIVPFYRRELSYIPLAGSLMEIFLIGLAMALRINQLRNDRYRLKNILVHTLRNQTRQLESTVAERTQALTEALRERDTLYRELQHRVKNHFQTILSFIWLQKSHENDKKTAESLDKTHQRIQAMSLLHERLCPLQSDTVDACGYFRDLLDNTVRFYGNPHITLKFHCNAAQPIAAKTASTFAMILNELVVNAFKHAFTPKESGTIQAVFEVTSNGDYRLVVEDDGRGSDDIVDGLGWTIIDEMLRDLPNAVLHRHNRHKGLYVEIRSHLDKTAE